MTALCTGSGGRRTEEDKKCGELSDIEYYFTKEMEIAQTLFTACEKAMKDFAKLHKNGDTKGSPGPTLPANCAFPSPRCRTSCSIRCVDGGWRRPTSDDAVSKKRTTVT